VAWSDDDQVRRESERVQGGACFYDDKIDLTVDGAPPCRPGPGG
jgi:hypothetical protein